MWNRLDHRPLEGFVYAVTPFNFTAIGGNLPDRAGADGQHGGLEAVAPRHCSATTRHEAAEGGGAAAGRHQLRPRRRRSGAPRRCSADPDLAGIHFTGSTAVFQTLWQAGRRADIDRYAHLSAHRGRNRRQGLHRSRTASADPARAGDRPSCAARFEYQGQKCSAASRAYIPETLWPEVRDRVVAMIDDDPHGRRGRLPELHGRGDRPAGVRPASPATSSAAQSATRREDPRRRRSRRRQEGWFIQPTLVQVGGPEVPH